MVEGRDTRDPSKRLQFMYRKISVPRMSLSYWLTVPEFLNAMLYKLDHSESIDDESVYNVMVDIYNTMYYRRDNGLDFDFNFYQARKSLNHLKRALGIE